MTQSSFYGDTPNYATSYPTQNDSNTQPVTGNTVSPSSFYPNGSQFATSVDPGDTLPLMDGVAAVGTSAKWSRQDHVHPTDTSRAPVASPSFTGTVGVGTSTTQATLNIQANTSYLTNENGPQGLEIASGYTVGSDWTLYMGADNVNHVGYIQSVKWGTATATLVLNGRGGNVSVGGIQAQNPSNSIFSTLHGSGSVGISDNRYSNDAFGGQLVLTKSRGVYTNASNTQTNTIVQSGDAMGRIDFNGADGTTYQQGATIQATVDGTPTAGSSMPGQLQFLTTPSGSVTPAIRMRITNSGAVGVGGTPAAGTSFRVTKNMTGAVFANSIAVDGPVQSDVTTRADNYISVASTAAATFTLPLYNCYQAQVSSFGAGSTVTAIRGYNVDSSLGTSGAGNVFGFYSDIASGANAYNLYCNGTATNYMAGPLGLGGIPAAGRNLLIGGTLTGNAGGSYFALANSTIQSDITGTAGVFRSSPSTAAAAFTLGRIEGFGAYQGTIGAGSTVTNQYGFFADAGLTGAATNYGFYSNLAVSGTSRYNFYAAGTAPNYFGGAVTVAGTLTVQGAEVVTGIISPAALSANTNNYNPANLATSSVVRISASSAVNLTGLAAQPAGTVIALVNVGSQPITLTQLDANSTAANQFNLGQATLLAAGAAALLFYDGTSSCWRPYAGAGGGGSSVYVQDTAPTTALNGSLWWQSSTGALFVYYADGTSNQWVSITQGTVPQAAVQYDVSQGLSSTQQNQAQKNAGIPAIMRSYLAGLTLSTAGSSATFSVAAGVAADSTNVDMMTLAASISKTTSAWAVGTGNGALDTGAIAASTWYHVHLIKRLDTQVVDVLVSLSATAPTLPTNYTVFRRIGSMKTNGSSQWTGFTQVGDLFRWLTSVQDVNAVNPGTAAVTRTLTVPTGVVVEPDFTALLAPATSGTVYCLLTALTETDRAPSGTDLTFGVAPSTAQVGCPIRGVLTNTSAQIRTRLHASATSDVLDIYTFGWIDTRGKLS